MPIKLAKIPTAPITKGSGANKRTYTFIEQKDNKAIFSTADDEGLDGYEVWIIGSIFRVPKDEDFGNTAWAYKTLEQARERLEK